MVQILATNSIHKYFHALANEVEYASTQFRQRANQKGSERIHRLRRWDFQRDEG